MPVLTTEQQLEQIQEAITRILEGGQEVQYAGRRVTYADLATLMRARDQLQVAVTRPQIPLYQAVPQ